MTAATVGPAAPSAGAAGLRRTVRRFLGNRLAVGALAVLGLILLVAAAAPVIAPYAPSQIDIANRLSGPTFAHWLGTDALGRDTLSRLMFAGRVSLGAASLAVAIAVVIGLPLGMVAGYLGGRLDWLLARAADVLMTFPALVLTVAIIAAVGPGLSTAMVSLGVVYSPRLFRIVRGATLGVRQETYVEASISIGTPGWLILRRHILPNILSPVLVQVSLLMAAALLTEVTISLLGLGALPPTASWGSMLGAAFGDIRSTPMLVAYPGMAIALVTLSFNLIGDGLRDSFGRETRKGER
ncbi:ABC transporter permease [Pseudonocardia eucalypti]|uniref:ABC transporter permease n=1 Tax=Pseudonocardia eucalypti TaxID=648755 RepID=A0ABP9QIU1_9PSEU|nr:peptide/nickel transport system permease protein [Pseudonocardia eucalypti]